jgi:hypothetical protein
MIFKLVCVFNTIITTNVCDEPVTPRALLITFIKVLIKNQIHW